MALLLALVGGCGLLGDNATQAFVSPGKFDYHNCDQLAEVGRSVTARAGADRIDGARGAGPGGEFVAGSPTTQNSCRRAAAQADQ